MDYTDYASILFKYCLKNQVPYGILVCGTGIGMSIVANKFSNVRAAIVHNDISAINSKDHNNANVICLGTWVNDNKKYGFIRFWLKQNLVMADILKELKR